MTTTPRRGNDLYAQLGGDVYGGQTLDPDTAANVNLSYTVDDVRELIPSRAARYLGTITPPVAVGRRSVLEILGTVGCGIWVDVWTARVTFWAFDLLLRSGTSSASIITNDLATPGGVVFYDEFAIANGLVLADWGQVLQYGTTTAPSLGGNDGPSVPAGGSVLGLPLWVPPGWRMTAQAQAANTQLAMDVALTLPALGGP